MGPGSRLLHGYGLASAARTASCSTANAKSATSSRMNASTSVVTTRGAYALSQAVDTALHGSYSRSKAYMFPLICLGPMSPYQGAVQREVLPRSRLARGSRLLKKTASIPSASGALTRRHS